MRKPIRFIVTGLDQGLRVRVLYRMQNAAMRYAKMLTNVEVYDIIENKYVYGTTKFCRDLLGNVDGLIIKDDIMQKELRYRVEGHMDGTFCKSVFKTKVPALRFANRLSDVEVFDMKEKKYIYGTSKFYRNLQREDLEALFV